MRHMTLLEKRLKKMTTIKIITKYQEIFMEIQRIGKMVYAAEISRKIGLPESVISKVLKHCERMKIPLIKKREELKGTRGKRKTLELTDVCKAGLRKLEQLSLEKMKDQVSIVENHQKSESDEGKTNENLIEKFGQIDIGVDQKTQKNKEKESNPKKILDQKIIEQLRREWEVLKKVDFGKPSQAEIQLKKLIEERKGKEMTWLDITNYIAEGNQKLYPEIFETPEKFAKYFGLKSLVEEMGKEMTWIDVTNFLAEINQKLYPEIFGSPEKFLNHIRKS